MAPWGLRVHPEASLLPRCLAKIFYKSGSSTRRHRPRGRSRPARPPGRSGCPRRWELVPVRPGAAELPLGAGEDRSRVGVDEELLRRRFPSESDPEWFKPVL